MVRRRFIEGVSWLHARVGREVPRARIGESIRGVTNSRAKVMPLARPALQPTVYLPSCTDKQLVA